MGIAEELVEKWKMILNIDPIWKIDLDVFNDASMPGAYARVDTSTAEYFLDRDNTSHQRSLRTLDSPEKRYILSLSEIQQ